MTMRWCVCLCVLNWDWSSVGPKVSLRGNNLNISISEINSFHTSIGFHESLYKPITGKELILIVIVIILLFLHFSCLCLLCNDRIEGSCCFLVLQRGLVWCTPSQEIYCGPWRAPRTVSSPVWSRCPVRATVSSTMREDTSVTSALMANSWQRWRSMTPHV